jgi:formamidopyrimidine-DNA glycosylase
MPELPDVSVYLERLSAKVVGQRLERVRIGHPFLLRSVTPPISAIEGKVVVGVERLGKRIVLAFEGDLFMVVHLMIAGRLRWLAPDKKTAPNALASSSSRPARSRSPRQQRRCRCTSSPAAPRSRRSTPAAST